MKVTYHSRTDPGQIRELNEDRIAVVQPKRDDVRQRRGDLLVVADGMGGHEAGEVASSQAVETIVESYYRSGTTPQAALQVAIQDANSAIFQRSRAEGRQGMGTTVVAAARVGDALHIAHVGDSRIYLIREGRIRPLTQDHSFVAEQVAAGIITPEEAEHHPNRNVISRAVGTSPRVEVEISALSPLALKEGDTVVLCSDGLTEHIKPNRILQLVRDLPTEMATQALVDAANAAGGSDNISVIIARVGDAPSREVTTARMPAVTADATAANATAPMRAVRPAPASAQSSTLVIPSAAAPPSARERVQATRATRVEEGRKGCAGSAIIGLIAGLVLGGAIFLALNNFVATDLNPGASPTSAGADMPAILPTTPPGTLTPTATPTIGPEASSPTAESQFTPLATFTPALP